MIVKCSRCGMEMEIDTPNGMAYITEADGSIHHEICMRIGDEIGIKEPVEEPFSK